MKIKTKILVVDDESQNIEIMREILSFEPQYTCEFVMSGEDAFRKLEKFFPDIILLDIMMPRINGFQVCEEIRKNERHKFSKIILISGLSMTTDRLKGYQAGADDYITKPFVDDELVAKLEVYSKLSRMEELDNLKTTALNMLGHETRTPLNGVMLGSELLRDLKGLPPEAISYIDMIRDSGNRMNEFIEKVAKYCSIKGGIEVEKTNGKFHSAVTKAIQSCNMRQGVSIEVDYDYEIEFLADWDLLVEVLGYLVDNAIKYNKDNGNVVISCSRDEDITIKISDEGKGIDPALKEKIYDGLFSANILNHQEGTGLSLALSREIIEAHDGTITSSEGENEGTVFTLTLKQNGDSSFEARGN